MPRLKSDTTEYKNKIGIGTNTAPVQGRVNKLRRNCYVTMVTHVNKLATSQVISGDIWWSTQ